MVDLSRQQEKCGCEGERARDTDRERERERECPLGFAVPVQGCYPPFPPPALLAPRSSGTSQIEQRQHLQHKCLNPNTQMHTYISLSLFSCLSFLAPYSHTIAYLSIPREMHEYGEGKPGSTCKLPFSVCVFHETWQGWPPLLRLFIYMRISGF